MSAARPRPDAPASGRPWHREPLVWMVVAIPLSSVAVGMVMLWLSVASYDGLVADDYYKRGLEIDRVLDRDRAAARAGLSGELHAGAGGTRLRLDAGAPGFVTPPSVTLALSYATRAGLDRELRLAQVSPGDYAGPALTLAPGRWYVQVGDEQWRLTGAMQVPGSGRLSLGPGPAAGAP